MVKLNNSKTKEKGHKQHLHDDYDIWEFTRGNCQESNIQIDCIWVKGYQDDDTPFVNSPSQLN